MFIYKNIDFISDTNIHKEQSYYCCLIMSEMCDPDCVRKIIKEFLDEDIIARYYTRMIRSDRIPIFGQHRGKNCFNAKRRIPYYILMSNLYCHDCYTCSLIKGPQTLECTVLSYTHLSDNIEKYVDTIVEHFNSRFPGKPEHTTMFTKMFLELNRTGSNPHDMRVGGYRFEIRQNSAWPSDNVMHRFGVPVVDPKHRNRRAFSTKERATKSHVYSIGTSLEIASAFTKCCIKYGDTCEIRKIVAEIAPYVKCDYNHEPNCSVDCDFSTPTLDHHGAIVRNKLRRSNPSHA